MKIKNIIIIILLLTLSFLTIFYTCFSKKFEIIAENHLNKEIKLIISDYKSYVKIDNKDLLSIEKNNNNEIIYMNYNMDKIYKVVDEIVSYIEKKESILEKGIWLNIPMGTLSNNIFLANFGPKIPVGLHFIGKIIPEVKTSVNNYGLNNALISIILEIKISYRIISPVKYVDEEISYEVLLDSFITQGSVPNWYNNIPKEKVFLEK